MLFECDVCQLKVKSRFNLNRHKKLMHENHQSKYLKHIKKDKKYVCVVCSKEYADTKNLKKHYIDSHKPEELNRNNVDLQALV